MAYVATYDASSYVSGDIASWPVEPPGGYSPGDWYYVTVAGTIDGQTAEIGDRLYPVGRGRLYGEDGYGDELYGGAPPPAPWPANLLRVTWRVAAYSAAPAWDRPPAPYDGCLFRDGWRLVVEAFYLSPSGGRTYGEGSYGDALYGDVDGSGVNWQDLTSAAYGITVERGGEDGAPSVDVDRATLTLLDVDASRFPMAASAVRRVTRSTPLRISLVAPDGEPYPLFTGRVQELQDEHDGDNPRARSVEIRAYGMGSDLVRTISFDRDAEAPDVRLAALIAQSGYSWGVDPPPATTDVLRRTDPQTEVGARDWIDRTAISASWTARTAATGVLRFLPWPLQDSGEPPLDVSDTLGAVGVAASSVSLVVDDGEPLNVVSVVSAAVQGSPEIVVELDDPPSVAALGRGSEVLGFPLTGLSSDLSATGTIAAAALSRYSRIASRLASFTVYDVTDPRWLQIAAALDVGRAVTFRRTKPSTAEISGIVCGWRHSLTPGDLSSTVYLTTTTVTEL